ncbi:MAG: MATE family efflux transporter [Bacilli bacterium]|nr:MATE family efflux transporter [Bacilli bacterium]
MIAKGEMDMTNGNLFTKIFLYSLPLIFSGILQLLYTAADLIICGNFGSDNAVGAISATTPLISLILNLVMGFAVGANVIVGRAYGAKDVERGERGVHSAMAMAIVSSVIMVVIGTVFARPLLHLMNTPSDVIDLSIQYLLIYFWGSPFLIIYNFGASILRGMGDTKKPFYFLAISGVVNIVLNIFFVIVLKMDVAGVALATIISEAVSAALTIISLIRDDGFVKLNLKKIKFHKYETIMIIRIGLPSGIQGALFSISNVIIQTAVNGFGSSAVTGNGISGNLVSFMYVIMNSFSQAGMAFVAANFGARKVDNVKKSIRFSILYSVVTSYLVCLTFYLLRNQIVGFYTSDPVAIEIASSKLQVFTYSYMFFAFLNTIGFCERGLGYSILPMLVSLIGICAFRIVYVFTIFQIPQYHTIYNLYLSYPLSWLIAAIVAAVAFLIIRKKAYAKVEFIEEDKLS